MNFLLKRGKRYYYNRRVPDELNSFDNRELIRVSLRTSDLGLALKRAETINSQIEKYWQNLVDLNETYNDIKYKQSLELAKMWGISYHTSADIVDAVKMEELLARVRALIRVDIANEPVPVAALLGGEAKPEVTVQKALNEFWKFAKDKVINKSPDQIRKWENPRKKAVKNFITAVGNKNLQQITRFDILNFRDWWIGKIQSQELTPSSANKDLIHIKSILELVSDNLKLDLDIQGLFKKINMKEHWAQTRLPFTTDYILSDLLNKNKLVGLGMEEINFLFAFADTGARGTELVGLDETCIILDHAVPHIKIRPRRYKELKTDYSERDIPLVGFALEALKKFPKGFTKYKDKPDYISTVINRFLRENKIFPSDQHSVYSLRHSFQDRLTSIDTPDRIQAELMGHKFNRPKYGDGPTLELKLEWMNKIKLK